MPYNLLCFKQGIGSKIVGECSILEVCVLLHPKIRNVAKIIYSILDLLLCKNTKMFTLVCWERLFSCSSSSALLCLPYSTFRTIALPTDGVLTKRFPSSYQLAAYVAENALVFLRNVQKNSRTFYEGISSVFV